MSVDEAPVPSGTEDDESLDAELARALEAYLGAVEAGRPVDPERLAAEHPAIAEQLRSCLGVLRLAGRVEGKAEADTSCDVGRWTRPAGLRLGDFRILRPIGRGGMGIVYEAEQVSLDRRVALESAAVRRGARPAAVAAVPDRGAGGRAVAPHQHRAGLLGRLRARRALLRHAVHRGTDPGRTDPRPSPARGPGEEQSRERDSHVSQPAVPVPASSWGQTEFQVNLKLGLTPRSRAEVPRIPLMDDTRLTAGLPPRPSARTRSERAGSGNRLRKLLSPAVRRRSV